MAIVPLSLVCAAFHTLNDAIHISRLPMSTLIAAKSGCKETMQILTVTM